MNFQNREILLPKEFIIMLIILFGVLVIIFYLFFDYYSMDEYYTKYEKPKSIYGIVIEKIIEEKNRGNKIIAIKNITNDKKEYIEESDYLGIWNKINIGDTIFKNYNSDTLNVHKINGILLILKYNYGQSGTVMKNTFKKYK